MNKITTAHFIAVIVTAVALSSCSSTPATVTTADRMRGYADDQQAEVEKKNEIAKSWDNGQKMVASGKDDLAKGQAKVDKATAELEQGNEQLARGRRLVEEGTVMTEDALQRFREAYPGLELAPGV